MICLLRIGFDDADDPDNAVAAPVTERLGNYRIEHRDDGAPWELGRGAMGITYRAIDTSLQRAVALKLIDSEWVKRGAEARERFMREARAAASLRHPNVAAVYHFGIREESGQCFCAMELIEGETLEMRVRRTGPLDALTTVEIALQVCSALAAAEKKGLVHRDLKPANLMLVGVAPDENGGNLVGAEEVVVKVIDFGVAKALVEKPDAMGLTHGGFVGTPAFASPEQFTNTPVDVRSDIYSLGATLWYLLTGQMPFSGGSVEEIRASRQLHALPVEQLKTARVPTRLITLLQSMLALEPAARPGVHELAGKLESCRARIANRSQRTRRFALAAALIIIGLGGAVATYRAFDKRSVTAGDAPPDFPAKSIAVLPFESLSDETRDSFPADGVHEDILASLSKIGDLKLTSGASVRQYRKAEGAGRNLREIAIALGARNLLEGSVRRVGDRLLVKVQLTDALQDRLVWAERYDRSIADSITLQGELAMEIARALRARLSAEEQTSVATKPTQNAEAYVLFLQGLEQQSGAATFKGLTSLRTQERLFGQAVALDPGFALAHARLSQALAYIYHDFDPTEETRRRARGAAETALRLQPNLGDGHFADALCLYWTEKDYEGAVRGFAKAAQLLPNRAEVEAWASFVRRRQGRWSEALAGFERALERDPRNKQVLSGYFATQYFLRDWAAARRTSERAVAAASDTPTLMRVEKHYLSVWSAGDLVPLRESLAGVPPGVDPDGGVTLARWDTALMARDFAAAERAIVECGSDTILAGHGTPVPKGYFLGCVALARGDGAQAQRIFEEARPRMEAEVNAAPLEPFRHAQLGLLYAFMQRKEDALREGERAVELAPIEKDAIYGAQMLGLLAVTYAQTGERDRAIALIERLLVTPAAVLPAFEGSITLHELRLRRHWDPLRGHPRFEKLLADPEPATNYLTSASRERANIPAKSIAVLPFDNLSDDQANAFFAVGIQDEILTHLAKIADLNVISRASVLQYKSGPPRNLRDIGKELGVAHLLEGSVQREGGKVRVHAQLIDARNDSHLWAQTYDRDLADVFAIQSEIAKAIGEQLQARLSPMEKAAIEQRPTADLAAFDLYTRGRTLRFTSVLSSRGKNDLLQAVDLLNQAVARDPAFLLAWCELAAAHDAVYFAGHDHTPARLALADAAVQTALRLRPDSGEAHLALAQHLYHGYLDYDRARDELAIAQRTLPNDPSVFTLAGNIDRRQGRWAESTRNLARAIELDPRNLSTLQNILGSYQPLRRYAEMTAVLDRALAIAPEDVSTRIFRASVDLDWRADPRPLHTTIEEILAKDPAAAPTLGGAWLRLALCQRDPAAVARALVALAGDTRSVENPNFVEGLMARVRGDAAAAHAAFTRARVQQEELTRVQPEYAPALGVLGLIDAGLGRKEEALREGRRALELLPIAREAIGGALVIQIFANICAWTDEKDLALEQLAIAAQIPGGITYGQLKLHPFWDPLRGDPRFEKIVASLAPK